ncbi:metal-dependent hydrolase [Candidatus Woesearchaeota archaeon]|jgi:inner membrane protein|nr:metal-dependent hydrolase [Candidatus Woesearchaeota archaeon]MBT4367810.1 metal-dependent hydrolase [Candidatus Woesearchaeota archaeon]MBT4712298.1 metal-dependent hydrolase [Candidatus Woesearchaeota archaeon]MBT6638846.1 metal-dependent hydrolase [Candidatus Woesearchaeota archaeon]MBT7134490.1 metal-dependent hydrolase [Candidatus Woesearchaeota archaeon]
MRYKTHIIFAILLSIIFIKILKPGNILLFLVISLIVSFLPDIDTPHSKLGRKVFFSRFLKHRGFWHSIWAVILFTFIIMLFYVGVYVVAFVVGYMSHLLIDMSTKTGISLLNPLVNDRIKGPIKTGSILEKAIFWIIFALILLVIII